MSYKVYRNVLAPKCTEKDGFDISQKSHMIMWNKCNFRCGFCYQPSSNNEKIDGYHELNENEFISLILDLMKTGKNFKFSGGEPTLNPRLKWDLKVVKDLGGTVFLDSNGSNTKIVQELIKNNLVDILAISLKGLTKEECMETAQVKNGKLCWENVFETIDFASAYNNVKVIVTHVCYNQFSMDELRKFSDLLLPYDNVYYKVNNLQSNEHVKSDYKRVQSIEVIKSLKQLELEQPKWKDHIIYIDDVEGVYEHSEILFM